MSFLSRSFERHFNERPYLKHSCYLYLTKTTKERNRMQSNFSTLCRGHIIPKELDKETAGKFMEAAEQFERIMNDSGFVRLRRFSTDELVGTEKSAADQALLFAHARRRHDLAGHRPLGKGNAHRRQPPVSAHPLRRGGYARKGSYRHPVRKAPPTARTAASPSPPPWGCCSPATTSTTSM